MLAKSAEDYADNTRQRVLWRSKLFIYQRIELNKEGVLARGSVD